MIRTGRRRWWHAIITFIVALLLLALLQSMRSYDQEPVFFRGDQNILSEETSDNGHGFTIVIEGSDSTRDQQKTATKTRPNSSKSTGDQKVCNVPKLDLYGAEVAKFFKPSSPFTCNGPRNWAFINAAGRFSVIAEKKEARCEISSILRVDDDNIKYGDWQEIRSGDSLPTDFVRTRCILGRQTWKGLLMSAVRNAEAADRAKAITQPEDWSGLDVYFLGLDSVSQMTFRRKLPKTVAYLEKVMGAIVLDAYNIVGDGTPQAFIPILTAQTEEELPLTRKRFSNAQYVDDAYPFIWRNFSDAGYVTAYGEDAAYIGTFTYRLKGFRNQPTDHLTRTFFQEHEKIRDTKCSGSISVHQNWYRYCKEFMEAYKDLPRFLLMHLSMFSHDDINQVGGLDDDIAAHLQLMHESGHFDKALVIVMADHGHRFATLRNTHQGQLEERLPFFSFALPKSLREGRLKKAWENLQNNKNILSTPFDIHATLNDVLHFPTDDELTTVQDPSQRSLSLFRPLPLSRNCAQAGVDTHWCTCLNWEDATIKEEDKRLVLAMARAVTQAFNDQTQAERKLCAPLKFKKLIYAKRMVPNEALLKYKNVKDADGFVPDLSGKTQVDIVFYQIKLVTTPGDAEYEITLHHEVSSNKLFIDLSAVSHINAYGDRPHCIIDKNYFLATYCVCYDRV